MSRIALLLALFLGVGVASGQVNIAGTAGGFEFSSYPATVPTGECWLGIFVIISVFLIVVYAGYKEDGKLDPGNIRRAMASTFTVGCFVVVILLMRIGIFTAIDTILSMAGMIVAFYFGTKALQ